MAVLKSLMILLGLTVFIFVGSALQQDAHAVSDTINKVLSTILILVACSGGSALLIIGLRNFCDNIERERMEKLAHSYAAAGEDMREETDGPRVDVLSRLMAVYPYTQSDAPQLCGVEPASA